MINLSVKQLIINLSDKKPEVKYSASRQLMAQSESEPQTIYPYLSDFVKLLDDDNNILKWTGIIVIGNLAVVDNKKLIDPLLPELFKLLDTGKMITANNAIQALAKIAASKPDLEDEITSQLLKVSGYKYDTAECGNIACGQVVLAIDSYLSKPDQKVLDFLQTISRNTRPATALKAQKLLKKYGKIK